MSMVSHGTNGPPRSGGIYLLEETNSSNNKRSRNNNKSRKNSRKSLAVFLACLLLAALQLVYLKNYEKKQNIAGEAKDQVEKEILQSLSTSTSKSIPVRFPMNGKVFDNQERKAYHDPKELNHDKMIEGFRRKLLQATGNAKKKGRCSSSVGWDFLALWKNRPKQPICTHGMSQGTIRNRHRIVRHKHLTFSMLDLRNVAVAIDNIRRDTYFNRSTTVLQLACQDDLGLQFLRRKDFNANVLMFNQFLRLSTPSNSTTHNQEPTVHYDAQELHMKGPRNHLPASQCFPSFANISRTQGSDQTLTYHHLPIALLVYREFHDNAYHTLETALGALQAVLLADIDPRNILVLFVDGAGPHTLDGLLTAPFGNAKMGVDPHLLTTRSQTTKDDHKTTVVCLGRAILSLSCVNGPVLRTTYWRNNPCQDEKRGNTMVQDLTRYIMSRLGFGIAEILPPSPLPPWNELPNRKKETQRKDSSRSHDTGANYVGDGKSRDIRSQLWNEPLRVVWLDRLVYGLEATGNEQDRHRLVMPDKLDEIGDYIVHEYDKSAHKHIVVNRSKNTNNTNTNNVTVTVPPYQVQFEVWNPRGYTIAQQIKKIRTTNVLVGFHGAALTHMAFQASSRTAVIEVRPPKHKGALHKVNADFLEVNIYPNVAQWYGRKYRCLQLTKRLQVFYRPRVKELGELVHELLREIVVDAYLEAGLALEEHVQASGDVQ